MNNDTKFVFRHAYRIGKAVFQAYPNPETWQLPSHVKVPDSNGDIHLTEKEEALRNAGTIFLKSTMNFEIEDGKEFDLKRPMDFAIWEAIKHNPAIVDSRTARDEKGNLIIDGDGFRYGKADYWIERSNAITNTSVNKEEQKIDAKLYIKKDSPEGLILKAKLLGKYINTMTINDLKDYLYGKAESDPESILDLYEGTDTNIRLLLVEAQEKGVIEVRDNIYYFGRNNILGANTDSVIAFLKAPSNHLLLETIKKTVHPTSSSKNYTESSATLTSATLTPTPVYTTPENTGSTFSDNFDSNADDIYADKKQTGTKGNDRAAKMRAAKAAKKAQKLAEERGYSATGEEFE
jgi:hypothetical protein